MKKLATIMLIVLTALLVMSCSTDRFGYVRFDSSRDILASIVYPTPESQVWTVTATKVSRGATVGEGTYDSVLLTEALGPFSVGQWRFTFDSETYHGEVYAVISEGENTIEVNASPVGEVGTLTFTNCNIPAQASGVYINCNGERLLGMGVQYMTERPDGRFTVPESSYPLVEGVYDIEVAYNGTMEGESFKVRVVNGLTTQVSFGIFQGTAQIVVNVDEWEALVE